MRVDQSSGLETVQANDKLTLVIENTMGFVVIRHVKFKSFSMVPDKSYVRETYLKLRYRIKSERNDRANTFRGQKIAIGLGWQEIADQPLANTGSTCFDGDVFDSRVERLQSIVYQQDS